MKWESITLILSLALNLILAFFIFFKKALNEVTVKWFSRRWERRDEKRTAMLELHERMDAFADDYLVTLLHFGTVNRGSTQQERDAFLQRRDELVGKLTQTHEFIRRHRLRFPRAVQALLDTLRDEILVDPDRLNDKSFLLALNKKVETVTGQLKKEIARRVRS